MKTWGQLKKSIREDVWPSGEAENLITPHDNIFQEGAALISKFVECEQQRNVDQIPFCKTNYKCGMTVIPAPRGIIKRVFTVANEQYCDPVFYRHTGWPAPECWARNLIKYTIPLNSGMAKLPLGFQFADASTDSQCGRARTGIWAIHDGNIYISPWIQSNELIIVEWEGIKKEWGENDLVNEAQDYRATLKLFLQYGHERDFGDMEKANGIHNFAKMGTFDESLGDLMWQCREETKVRETQNCGNERYRILAELLDDAVPPERDQVFAQIANIGSDETGVEAVAGLVRGWSPDIILAAGNLSGRTDYDLVVGKLFHDFISPYVGQFGSGAAKNAFYPAPGDLDWNMGDAKGFLDYLQIPGNERYYDQVIGSVHFFFLDSDPREPAGVLSTSPQALWLKAKLAASTAPYKVVICHHAPYSSGDTHGSNVWMQWPFAAWGATAVISGHDHDYERLSVGGIPYFVNGVGGRSIRGFATPLAQSQIRISHFGLMRLAVYSTGGMKFEFWQTAGVSAADSLSIGNVSGSITQSIAVIGDWGGDTSDESAVRTMVTTLAATDVVTIGDNIYPMSPIKSIDEQIGKHYASFIKPYTGSFGPSAAVNHFFPAIGNHDWDGLGDPKNLDPWTAFFSQLPNNKRYYDFCTGDVHFFVLDGSPNEPDGNYETSAQAEWLRAKMFLSAATWKVIVVNEAPYSSTGANDLLNWPFKSWGADMVISGKPKNYERFLVGNLVYIVNGLGGDGDIEPISSPASGSLLQYSANYGAGKLTASPKFLKYEFFATDGTLVDSVQLNK